MDFIVWLPAKIQVCITTFSSEKVISSESGEKSVQIKHCLQAKTGQHICGWILVWENTDDGLFHWRKCYGLWIGILKGLFKVKTP